MLEREKRELFMRVVGVAAMTALIGMAALATPAHAQMAGDGPHINLLSDTPSKTPDQIEAEQEQQKAYKDSLRKIPDAKTSNDPWGVVRSDAPKTAPAATAKAASTPKAKPKAKVEAKTGSNPN
jgi:hypothetical protein